MEFFWNIFKKNSAPGPADDFWYENVNGLSSAGVLVTHETAMQVAAVYSCVRVLSEAVASLPFVLYRRLPGGGKEEATDHPLYSLLKYQPNAWQTKFNFIQMAIGHQVLRGNFYAEKVFGRDGQVEALIPLHPGRMQTEMLKSGSLRFRYTNEAGAEEVYVQGELLRVTGLSSDGLKGVSVIESVRDTFGSAKQAQDYANRFFANGAQPGGILYSDLPMTKEVQAANQEAWNRSHKGARNAHKVAVLSALKWQSIGMSNSDSQFLETRKFTRSEICGLFGVPPHMVGDLERATFSNIEHQDIGFYKHTIRPYLVNIEQSFTRDVILEDDVFAEFKIDGLLRGDAKTRSEYYAKALGSGGSRGWMTQNEVRALENLNPIEGGDELPQPIVKEQPDGSKPADDDENTDEKESESTDDE